MPTSDASESKTVESNKLEKPDYVPRRVYRLQDVRTALAEVARQTWLDKMDVGKAKVLVYAYDTLAEWIKQRNLDRMARRLERIEAIRLERLKEKRQFTERITTGDNSYPGTEA